MRKAVSRFVGGQTLAYNLAVDANEAKQQVTKLRAKFGADVLVVAVKDSNIPGKLSISGDISFALQNEITKLLRSDEKMANVEKKNDEYDFTYDVTWRNTCLTTGHSTVSFEKAYFPRGRIIVQLLDLITEHGWTLGACPCFGGVDGWNDTGQSSSAVRWPVFVFYRESSQRYFPGHLLFAIKDANIPGKVCAVAGLVESQAYESAVTQVLSQFSEVECRKDNYDKEFDVVWRNTTMTSGHKTLSFAKAYCPKGRINAAFLECMYSLGWRLVGCPCFGGGFDCWPCYVFRRIVQYDNPCVLFCSVKDDNIPGKVLLSGRTALAVAESLAHVLSAEISKDRYDDDHDVVLRNTQMTTGHATFNLKLKYFPKADAVMALLNTMYSAGYTCVAGPKFGACGGSYPTFVFEGGAIDLPGPPAFLANKDANSLHYGKINLAGARVSERAGLQEDLLLVLQTFCDEAAEIGTDQYDQAYDLSFRKARLTTGLCSMSFLQSYFPHGFVLELILSVMKNHNLLAQAGVVWGNGGDSWPSFIFNEVIDKRAIVTEKATRPMAERVNHEQRVNHERVARPPSARRGNSADAAVHREAPQNPLQGDNHTHRETCRSLGMSAPSASRHAQWLSWEDKMAAERKREVAERYDREAALKPSGFIHQELSRSPPQSNLWPTKAKHISWEDKLEAERDLGNSAQNASLKDAKRFRAEVEAKIQAEEEMKGQPEEVRSPSRDPACISDSRMEPSLAIAAGDDWRRSDDWRKRMSPELEERQYTFGNQSALEIRVHQLESSQRSMLQGFEAIASQLKELGRNLHDQHSATALHAAETVTSNSFRLLAQRLREIGDAFQGIPSSSVSHSSAGTFQSVDRDVPKNWDESLCTAEKHPVSEKLRTVEENVSEGFRILEERVMRAENKILDMEVGLTNVLHSPNMKYNFPVDSTEPMYRDLRYPLDGKPNAMDNVRFPDAVKNGYKDQRFPDVANNGYREQRLPDALNNSYKDQRNSHPSARTYSEPSRAAFARDVSDGYSTGYKTSLDEWRQDIGNGRNGSSWDASSMVPRPPSRPQERPESPSSFHRRFDQIGMSGSPTDFQRRLDQINMSNSSSPYRRRSLESA